jgi:glucose/arabinose dehydrogenase
VKITGIGQEILLPIQQKIKFISVLDRELTWQKKDLILAGYKVIFIPFIIGKPARAPEDFLTGFISDLSNSKVHGRPVGIAVLADGSMLVSDDVSNTNWRISTKN